ncbi:EF-P lysine aminoacylase EpmA [Magnetospirillum molischianum]|uniref:Putative lysyl-tRNA synthetase (Lysine--tRNA ligase) n=1 Tax=Magnetospirillum molischianum DSM 120 TaxID=1150626 RepID=H8FSH8_MAGML|nr:EF-P lysine aminoacylase EpmA [Magnetospirillum molischianum]CCG41316.1 Putative lysyl-tRNA synthetase (Lysine--tRNA ligase) [Magnetospirillum molischianum DSM 120]
MSAGKVGVEEQWWRPERFALRRERLEARAKIVEAVRAFFAVRCFTEVETPCLQVSPGMEPHLKWFSTALTDPYGGPDRTMGLHTSPEFAMKKLLVAGMPKIYQMARVFRNAERSDTHHPEFTMLEWYRTGAPLDALMDDTEALVAASAEAIGVTRLSRLDRVCDPFQPWRRLSVAQAFRDYAGIDLLATAPDPLVPQRDLIAAEAARIGISFSASDRWDDIVFRIMMDRIEPHLGFDAPVFLHSWPLSMAALARPSVADNRVAERFEVYVLGVELANAFGELTDAAEQRRRFAEDQALARSLYGAAPPADEDFLAALEYGMPDSAGIALGFDRLVMLLTGATRIDDVLWAPV